MTTPERILVTGATGFIGGRLVERLAREGRRVRIVTSDFSRCARVARFPVELIKADLRSPATFAKAVEGCDVVFHLAYRFGDGPTDQRRINIEGTRALAEAALAARVRRFVHFGSVASYGRPRDGELTEETTPANGDVYSDTKRCIDDMLLRLHRERSLPVAIIQPTIVYGPYGSTWTTPLINLVRNGRIALPASDRGLCNAVYVDDVVSAALLAAEREAAIGQTFLISAADPVSWQTFFAAYEEMAGRQAVVRMEDDELRAESRRSATRPSLGRLLRNALARRPELRDRLLSQAPQKWIIDAGKRLLSDGTKSSIERRYQDLWKLPSADLSPVYIPDPDSLALYMARTHVKIDKAARVLGFAPVFDLAKGMSRTALWARWANLLRG